MAPEPNERTAKLTSVPSETEAAIVISALDENGIRAESDEYTSGLRAGPWNWVEILVDQKDLARAKEILAKVQEENDHIDWSQVDVGEPESE
jgi:putative signal transducing protein